MSPPKPTSTFTSKSVSLHFLKFSVVFFISVRKLEKYYTMYIRSKSLLKTCIWPKIPVIPILKEHICTVKCEKIKNGIFHDITTPCNTRQRNRDGRENKNTNTINLEYNLYIWKVRLSYWLQSCDEKH